jgi:hypothetical protein
MNTRGMTQLFRKTRLDVNGIPVASKSNKNWQELHANSPSDPSFCSLVIIQLVMHEFKFVSVLN